MSILRVLKLAKYDDQSSVRGYERVSPAFNHSVDLWEEVMYWSEKCDGNSSQDGMKGIRSNGVLRKGYGANDWMNHAASRLAAS